ncbi:hypothetical protein [Kitasatospora sp. NPDC017646]|uniref:hypothetical protein n=1 Tax=Kitasatospora sp. NPDC017646 TaxID=3364024 RepID=UPI0037AF57A3
MLFSASGLGFVALLGLSLMLLATPLIVWVISPDTVMLIPGRRICRPAGAGSRW